VARRQKLKVFRTPIGFHDAYVAAPSRKAALEVWGAESNLFAQGIAEQVTDPSLMQEPLASPGVVIRKLRGTHKEQIAAIGEPGSSRLRGAKSQPPPAKRAPVQQRAPRAPKPSRGELSDAEEAVKQLSRDHAKAVDEIARREKELARERQQLERKQSRELAAAEDRAADLRRSYEEKLAKWQNGA
jgi:hypothetical protein